MTKLYPYGEFDYKSTSRDELLNKIVEFYKDYNNIISICSYNELLLLKEIYENENYNRKAIDEKIESFALQSKYLLIRSKNKYYVVEECADSINKAINNFNEDVMKNNDNMNKGIDLLLLLFPMDKTEEFIQRVHEVIKASKGELRDFLNNNYNFLFKVHLVDIKNEMYYVSDAVYSYYKEIYKERKHYRQFHLNISSPKKLALRFRDFLKCYIVDDEILDDSLSYIRYGVDICLSVDEILEMLKDNVDGFDVDKYKDKVTEIVNNLPSCALNGLTMNEYEKYLEKDIIYSQFKVEKVNSKLSKKDYLLFNKLYSALLEFTNNKYNVSTFKNIYNHEFNDYYYIIDEVVESFFKNKNLIIKEFIKANPYNFTKKELAMVKEFKKSITADFDVLFTTSDHLGLVKSKKIYMVKTCGVNFNKTFDVNNLPITTNVSIIPFKNMLVCSGIFTAKKIYDENNVYEWLIENIDNIQKIYSL